MVDGPTATALVGREREFGLLADAVAEAAGGSAVLVRIEGDPGTGKSRLATDCLTLAKQAGFAVTACRGEEQSATIPFGAATHAVGRLLRAARPEARHRLVDGLTQLSLLLPGLGLPAGATLSDPGLQRLALHSALTQLLDRVSRGQPLLWVVDDADRLDSASVELLH
ncbi:MAG: ATP-binding protein, partial [Sciscionella sp.]